MTNDRHLVPPRSHADAPWQFRLMRVTRNRTQQLFEEWTVELRLTGASREIPAELEETAGPTRESMEATVQRLAQQSGAESIEEFACELMEHLYDQSRPEAEAEVAIASHLWKRLTTAGEPSPAAFMKGSDERQTTRVRRTGDKKMEITSGFREMTVLRVTHSEANRSGMHGGTAMPESTDGLLGIVVTAEWQYTSRVIAEGLGFNKLRHQLRECMITAFAQGDSTDVQQTVNAIAAAALEQTGSIGEIALQITKRNLLPAGPTKNTACEPNRIFVPGDEVDGSFEAVVKRIPAPSELHG